jgi:hypothetical protein
MPSRDEFKNDFETQVDTLIPVNRRELLQNMFQCKRALGEGIPALAKALQGSYIAKSTNNDVSSIIKKLNKVRGTLRKESISVLEVILILISKRFTELKGQHYSRKLQFCARCLATGSDSDLLQFFKCWAEGISSKTCFESMIAAEGD